MKAASRNRLLALAVAAALALPGAALVTGCKNDTGPAGTQGFYVTFPVKAAKDGKVKQGGPGSSGWVGQTPPPGEGYRQIGTVPKGLYAGDPVWKKY